MRNAGNTKINYNELEKAATHMGTDIGFMKLSENAILPTKGHPSDSGFDLYTAEDIVIAAGGCGVVYTNITIQLPEQFEAMVRPRSGVTSKTTARVQIGTIDNQYTGDIGIIVDNAHKSFDLTIPKGYKLAQLVVQELPKVNAIEVFEVTETDRGTKGFGSTGTGVTV